jgi:uncharacterized protein (UPF0333 family)
MIYSKIQTAVQTFAKNKGYTLLFAVLVSALVLAIGVSILNTSREELVLTAGARNSEYAFYAADSGYECALYNDYNGPGGGTMFSTTTPPSTITCGTIIVGGNTQSQVSSIVSLTTSSGPIYDFTFSIPISGNACAFVDVNKIYNSSGVSTTTISSLGYNIGAEGTSPNFDCNGKSNNTEKVDRELVTTYSWL